MVSTPLYQIMKLGQIDYLRAWQIQREVAEEVRLGNRHNTVILLEHPHVYTRGRLADPNHILLTQQQLTDLDINLVDTDRGGLITYHGPGQLVAYPIINLRTWGGPLKYVRALEKIIITALSDFNIEANCISGLTGVWVNNSKIAAIGVKISQGITFHGLSINVNTDLSYFKNIVPCGISDKEITSMEAQLSMKIDQRKVEDTLACHFGQIMGFHFKHL
jgi:lipoyl(octanoyl) transferase